MNTVQVVDVIDGNTLVVAPSWTVNNRKGSSVRIHGMAAPPLSDARGILARYRLTLLVIGGVIQIPKVYGLSEHGLVCSVFYKGLDLTQHFPEYTAVADNEKDFGTDLSPSAFVLNLDEV